MGFALEGEVPGSCRVAALWLFSRHVLKKPHLPLKGGGSGIGQLPESANKRMLCSRWFEVSPSPPDARIGRFLPRLGPFNHWAATFLLKIKRLYAVLTQDRAATYGFCARYCGNLTVHKRRRSNCIAKIAFANAALPT